jgi:hypothetical protein
MGANMKGELNRKRPVVMLCNEKLLHGNSKKMSLSLDFQPKIDVFLTISIGKKNKPSINQKSENEQTPNPCL